MCKNEFITDGGDTVNTLWTSRRSRICQILNQFIQDKVQIIGLQENDHPYFILNELQQFKPEIRCIHLLAQGANRSADKLRIAAIEDYLNSNDSSFREASSNVGVNRKDFESLYSRVNEWFKANNLTEIKKEFTMTSFAEEHDTILQQFLKRKPEDLYLANDGLSIYYDSSVLKYIGPIPCSLMSKTDNPTLFIGKILACSFEIRKNNAFNSPSNAVGQEELENSKATNMSKNGTDLLTVICGHLNSGEGVENETRRVEQLRILLKTAKENDGVPIILIDSNTSDLYRKDIEKSGYKNVTLVDSLIHEAGFKNIVPTKGNQCFKMRHARGSQPNKFGNFMFDTIDKILIRPETCDTFGCMEIKCPKKFDISMYDEILSWRVDEAKREGLKRLCRDQAWGDNMEENKTDDSKFDKNILLQLYPNQNMPSDHPPVGAEICLVQQNIHFHNISK
jgi:hypothetical protein